MAVNAVLVAAVKLMVIGLASSRSLEVPSGAVDAPIEGVPVHAVARVPRVPDDVSGDARRTRVTRGVIGGVSGGVPTGVPSVSGMSASELSHLSTSELAGVLSKLFSRQSSGVSARRVSDEPPVESIGVLESPVADRHPPVASSDGASFLQARSLRTSAQASSDPSRQPKRPHLSKAPEGATSSKSEHTSAEASRKISSHDDGTSEDVHDPDSDMSDVDDIDDPDDDAQTDDNAAAAAALRAQKALIYASSGGSQNLPSGVIASLNDIISGGTTARSFSSDGVTPFPVYDRRFTGSRSLFPLRDRRPTRLRLWPDGVIPYSISTNYTTEERQLIDRVFHLFESVTCLRLVPRTNEKDYVRITPTGRCSGEVGRRGGRQKISLPHWCLSFGHAAHELMHTAGFWHEHQRPDRDQFVRVLWDNIKPRHRRADYGRRVWEELGEGSWLGPYDYHSILHYSGRGSAVDRNKPTMVARQAGVTLGGSGNLTDIDIWKINTQYHCWQRGGSNVLYDFDDGQLGGREGRKFGKLVAKEESAANTPRTSLDREEVVLKEDAQKRGTATFTSRNKSTAEVLDAIKELVEYKSKRTSSAKEQNLADSTPSTIKAGAQSTIENANVQTAQSLQSKPTVTKDQLQSFQREDTPSFLLDQQMIETREKNSIADVTTNEPIPSQAENHDSNSPIQNSATYSHDQDHSRTTNEVPFPNDRDVQEPAIRAVEPRLAQEDEQRRPHPPSASQSTSTLTSPSVHSDSADLGNTFISVSPKQEISERTTDQRQSAIEPENQPAFNPLPQPANQSRVRVVIKLKDLVKPTTIPPSSTTSSTSRTFDRVIISLADLQRLRANRQSPLKAVVQKEHTETQDQRRQQAVMSLQLRQHQSHNDGDDPTQPSGSQRVQRKLQDDTDSREHNHSTRTSVDKNNPFSHVGGFRIGDRWFFSRSPQRQQPDQTTTTAATTVENPFRHIGGFKVGNEWRFFRRPARAKRSLKSKRRRVY